MRILGIDPGSTKMGFAVLDNQGGVLTPLIYGTTVIKEKNLSEKLLAVRQQLLKIIRTYKPNCVGLEQLFFAKNKKTALEVAHARGVIALTILENKIPLLEFTPAQVKIAVANYGSADKQMVAKMVCAILKLKSIKGDDNAADALAVAIAAAHYKSY